METAEQPYISVIVPVYNAADYLQRCIDSILNQTYKHFEIICIDDGSSDGSERVLDDYQALYPNVVRVCHQENAGVVAARNRGIRMACGDYLAFVDNDDWLDSDWMETLAFRAGRDCAVDVICSGYRRPDGQGRVLYECRLTEGGQWSPYLVGAAWARLYRAEYIRENGINFFQTNIGEDIPFVISAIGLASNCVVLDYCGYNWFFNTSSVSNTAQRRSEGLQFERTLDYLLAELKGRSPELGPMMTRFFIRHIAWFLFFTREGDGFRRSLWNLRYYEAWLTANIPGWRECPLAGLRVPSDDTRLARLEVWLLAKHPALFRSALLLRLGCR